MPNVPSGSDYALIFGDIKEVETNFWSIWLTAWQLLI